MFKYLKTLDKKYLIFGLIAFFVIINKFNKHMKNKKENFEIGTSEEGKINLVLKTGDIVRIKTLYGFIYFSSYKMGISDSSFFLPYTNMKVEKEGNAYRFLNVKFNKYLTLNGEGGYNRKSDKTEDGLFYLFNTNNGRIAIASKESIGDGDSYRWLGFNWKKERTSQYLAKVPTKKYMPNSLTLFQSQFNINVISREGQTDEEITEAKKEAEAEIKAKKEAEAEIKAKKEAEAEIKAKKEAEEKAKAPAEVFDFGADVSNNEVVEEIKEEPVEEIKEEPVEEIKEEPKLEFSFIGSLEDYMNNYVQWWHILLPSITLFALIFMSK